MVQVSGWNVVWQRCQAAATDKLFYHSRTLLPQPDGACRSYESHYLALDGMFGRMRRQTSGKRRMLTRRRQPLKASKLGSHMRRTHRPGAQSNVSARSRGLPSQRQ